MSIPLPILAGVYRTTFVYTPITGASSPCNVMHFESVTGTATANDLNAALTATVTHAMWTPLTQAMGVQTVEILALDGHASTLSFSTGLSSNWAGSGVLNPAPQVAALIKLQTGQRGRSYRGRIYLPDISESAINGGTLAGGNLTTTQSAWQTFLAAIQTASPSGFRLGVASYQRQHGGAGAFFTPVTSLTVESWTATQRRRQPGRKVSRH